MLVLDDEAPIREMGRRFLQQWGYKSVEADSIDAAIDVVRKTEVVAAILDVRVEECPDITTNRVAGSQPDPRHHS